MTKTIEAIIPKEVAKAIKKLPNNGFFWIEPDGTMCVTDTHYLSKHKTRLKLDKTVVLKCEYGKFIKLKKAIISKEGDKYFLNQDFSKIPLEVQSHELPELKMERGKLIIRLNQYVLKKLVDITDPDDYIDLYYGLDGMLETQSKYSSGLIMARVK